MHVARRCACNVVCAGKLLRLIVGCLDRLAHSSKFTCIGQLPNEPVVGIRGELVLIVSAFGMYHKVPEAERTAGMLYWRIVVH
jgi:hypothetical protein